MKTITITLAKRVASATDGKRTESSSYSSAVGEARRALFALSDLYDLDPEVVFRLDEDWGCDGEYTVNDKPNDDSNVDQPVAEEICAEIEEIKDCLTALLKRASALSTYATNYLKNHE